jgi:hypothetical protein
MERAMLIGIAGPKRSGKDTLARGLCAALGLSQDSFAGPLRAFVANTLGMTLAELEDAKEAPIAWLDGITPRHLMQTVGTEWGRRMIHADLWLRACLARLPAEGAVISDVRFPNEAEAITNAGGAVIRISRPGAGEGDSHASETPLPNYLVTFELANDSTPEALVERALGLLRGTPQYVVELKD